MVDCIFPEVECCNIPVVDRTGTISKIILVLTSYTADELCVLASNSKTSSTHKEWFDFVIDDNGNVIRLTEITKAFADPVVAGSDPQTSLYIGITYPVNAGSRCSAISSRLLEDSLTRIICCIAKETGQANFTGMTIQSEYTYNDELDYLYVWLNPVILRLKEKRVPECLSVDDGGCFDCSDADDSDEGTCNCTSSCSKTCGCNVIPLYCRQIGALDNLQADFAALQLAYSSVVNKYTALQNYIDTQIPQIVSLAATASQFQNFYGTYVACLRKLCVLDGCFDCKVHYTAFAPQTIFPGIYVPLNFEKKVTDNDPSDVSTLGFFRYCPAMAGTYRVELDNLTLAPTKYCDGDKIEVRLSNGNVIYTHVVAGDSPNLTIQLPHIESDIYLSGNCLQVELKVTSKEAVSRTFTDGNIIIYPII